MENEEMERKIYGLEKDVTGIVRTIDTLTENVNKLIECSFRIGALETGLREYKQMILDLSASMKKIEVHILSQTCDRDIIESRADREKLWEEIEDLKEEINGIHLQIARTPPPKAPEIWWEGRVAEWAAKIIWLVLGGMIAWALHLFGNQK
jgi:uncharacterized coiled-coil DUF342 family protein